MKDENYFLKNFIAKLLGLIAAREFPNCFESFIKIILDSLQNAYDEEPDMIDMYLRILLNILEETDEGIAVIAGDVLPVVLNIFKLSNVINIIYGLLIFTILGKSKKQRKMSQNNIITIQ